MSGDASWFDSGWAVALVAGAWGLVTRILIGKYAEHAKENTERNRSIDDTLDRIDRRLSRLEGRFEERDRNGTRTWPGDIE